MPHSPIGDPDQETTRLGSDASASDTALMRQYLRRHDESAFARLVERHGPMVLATCRRQLGISPEADDAFQATFLVLVRKGESLRRRDLLGPWLHAVACRVAAKLRRVTTRRHAREIQMPTMPEQTSTLPDAAELADGLALLDQALAQLPDKYRIPLVLCELQGLSRREAARRLGLSEGTLSSRLSRGRERLRRRLERHLGTLTIALLLLLLSQARAPAAVPPNLARATIRAAHEAAAIAAPHGAARPVPVALAEGVVKTMLLSKLKLTAICLLAICLAGGAGVAIHASSKPQDDQIVGGVWVAIDDDMEGVVVNGVEINEDQLKALAGDQIRGRVVEGFELFVEVGDCPANEVKPQK